MDIGNVFGNITGNQPSADTPDYSSRDEGGKSGSEGASRGLGGGFWSSVVGTVGDLGESFNYKGQENQIKLAQLQKETAEANSKNQKSSKILGIDKKYLFIGVGVVILIGIMVMAGRHNN